MRLRGCNLRGTPGTPQTQARFKRAGPVFDRSEQEMEVLSQMTEGMRNFATRYNIAINDPKLSRLYRMQQDAEREEATRLSIAESRGERRGERRGADRKNRQNAKRLIAHGIDPVVISDVTGLSLEEIARL